jgi:hypothetical protein
MRSKKKDKEKKYIAGGMFVLPALQAGLGIYQTIQGQEMAKGLEEPSTEKPSEYAEMLKLSRNRELEERRLDELNRNLATGIAAAQAGGGRALVGSLPGMVRAGDQGTIDILAKRQQDQMNALRSSAMGSERAIGRNISAYQRDLGAAQAAVEGGLQNIGGALGQAGMMAMYSDKKDKSVTPTDIDSSDFISQNVSGISDFTPEQKDTSSLIKKSSKIDPITEQPLTKSVSREINLPEQRDASSFVERSSEINSIRNPLLDKYLEEEELERILGRGRTRFLEKGGKMTKGAFNHDTNPIDIVQKGVKVGEMTGGEVILNPKQQAKLSKESAYFRKLLKKFNKNK